MADQQPAPLWAAEEVHVENANPAWTKHADQFAAEIHDLWQGWLTSPAVHVGSTAVPGLAAKPIIDLQATADDPAAAITDRYEAMLAASWFLVPRELDQRPWRWLVVRADAAGRQRLAHLHLMRPGEPRWHEQITFRDKLRADPALAQEYARLKAEAASTYPHDREAYTNAKHVFVRRVLDQSD